MSPNPRRQEGLSLLELVIAVGVATILLAVAVPDFTGVLGAKRNGRALQRLGATLAMARDQAILSNVPVTVCTSRDGRSCTGSAWREGWIVFADSVNPAHVDPDETVTLVADALDGTTTIRASGHGDSLTYLPDGTTAVVGGFEVCDGRGSDSARSVCILRTGIARVAEKDCDGEAITCT